MIGRPCIALAAMAVMLSGCVILDNLEDALFPPLPRNDFAVPPLSPGNFGVIESRFAVSGETEGEELGLTLFEPDGAGNGAAVVWILGLNHRAYYHQSLHEHLASKGYTVVVPDTPKYRFADLDYHSRILREAATVVDAITAGLIGNGIDPNRIAVGGYSIGGPLAAFVTAERPIVAGTFAWAPVEPPFWMRFDSQDYLPGLTQHILLIEGTLDDIAPPGVWRAQLEAHAPITPTQITPVPLGQAIHNYFQQPEGPAAYNPPTPLTREEQMGRAILVTDLWLGIVLAKVPEDL